MGEPSQPVERLAWLVRLRWLALSGVLVAVVVAPTLGVRGIHVPVLLGAVIAGALYNLAFLVALRQWPDRVGGPMPQVLMDFGALTLALWASGGVRNPFVSLYAVHVLLVSSLSGRRSALWACVAALGAGALLALTGMVPSLTLSTFDPPPDAARLVSAAAFAVTIVASAFVVDRTAEELARRQSQLAAARRAALRDAEILLSSMDRLEVGVEVLAPDGTPRFRNRLLLDRQGMTPDCPRDPLTHCEPTGGRCPVDDARAGYSGSCRFLRRDAGGRERVIELLSFPLGEDHPAPVLRLHLDRTESVLAERKLLFAERLASLGRTAQAVAHELNTPLATIQTLASDMRKALEMAPPEAVALARDLDESASIILDETRRCRAITQDLLARRDLALSGSASGPADCGAALERASILVFGSGGSKARLVTDRCVARRSVAIGHDALVQVFVNLFQNSLDAIEGRPGARVRVRAGDDGEQQVTVLIEDDGPGLTPGSRDRLFEPFYTTKPPGKGTGLGLYTAALLVREAGGSLTLENRAEGGARAALTLPVAVAS